MRHLLILSVASLLAVAALEAKPAEVETVDDSQDVLYFGPGRPALLRLHLRSGGEPVAARWKAFMAKFFAYLDRNDSGGLDRVEARMAPNVAPMQQLLSGNVYNHIPTRGTAQVDFQLLDADRDGRVSLEEFEDFYRKAGAGPVAVVANPRTAMGFVGIQDSLTERMFELLDTDKDGKLSKAEFDAAERVLIRLDANDDELISVAELGGIPNGGRNVQVSKEMLRQPARVGWQANQINPLVLLPRSDVPRRNAAVMEVVRALIKGTAQYKDNTLTLESSGLPQAFFDKFDTNKDGKLDAIELARWARGKPDGEITIDLAGPGGAGRISARSRATADDRTLKLDNVRLTVVPTNGNAGIDSAKDFLLGQLRAVDTTRKGFVARRELDTQTQMYLLAVFDLADRNGDGRLTEDELKTYIDTVQTAFGAQVNLSLSGTGQGLFQLLDTNGDGQLSVRELRQAWSRLSPFDADKDGCLSRDELPMQINLTVGPGSNGALRNRLALGMVRYAASPRSGDRGPTWFLKMDRNGDGDVSRTEWLGSKADFDRIDTDKDGLISVEEAEAFDAKVRKKK